ncbi:MAG: transketolase [Christensenellales bacterium]
MNETLVNYLRVTSCLEIEKAGSGHPGVCLDGAPIAFSIFKNAVIDCNNPHWQNRDRIVFSAGHASALLYACLNLFGYDIRTEDLQSFRQLGSKCKGHPEVNIYGVDATTGPLGQGVGMAVGMAVAEEYLRAKFSHGNLSPIDHYTYCFVGDGDLMEGVAQEAISFAGTQKLSRLILLYDKNDITIEGSTKFSNRENVKQKFVAMGWNVLEVEDGNSVEDIDYAILQAKKSDKPTIIVVKTKIGFGSELEGDASVHGKPLNKSQIEVLRKNIGYFVPDWTLNNEQKEEVKVLLSNKQNKINEYNQNIDEYKRKFPQDFLEYQNLISNQSVELSTLLKDYEDDVFDGRKALGKVLNEVYQMVPMLSLCADLTPSTKTNIVVSGKFCPEDRLGQNIMLGIREHAMGAVCNGIVLSGLRAVCSTFMSFANYMTPAIRLSAMMDIPALYVFTHDSILVGEDGPTHQPVEQIATLRAMPNLNVFRPCGREELLASLQLHLSSTTPSAVLISRSAVEGVKDDFVKALRGGYIISDNKNYVATLVSTGTEVSLCQKASKLLEKKGIAVRIVTMPCVEVFEKQSKVYKNKVLDSSKPIICVEASSDNIWHKYSQREEYVFGLKTFGESGKQEDVRKALGFEENHLAKYIEKVLFG